MKKTIETNTFLVTSHHPTVNHRIMRRNLKFGLVGILVIAIFWWLKTSFSSDDDGKNPELEIPGQLRRRPNHGGQGPAGQRGGMVEGKLAIDVYMESQCPDTSNFLDYQLKPTWDGGLKSLDFVSLTITVEIPN